MTNGNQPDDVAISGPILRDRVEKLFEVMGRLASSIKSMSYVSACMDTVTVVETLRRMAMTGDFGGLTIRPRESLDTDTLTFVIETLKIGVQRSIDEMEIVDIVGDSQSGDLTSEGPPPGVKPS